MLRYLLAEEWWPLVRQQDYQFVTAETRIINGECHPHCSFRQRRAQGDAENPPYLEEEHKEPPQSIWRGIWRHVVKIFGKIFWRS